MVPCIDIPLRGNSATENHCVQAVLQMALKHFFPEQDFSLEYLDRATNHHPGGWTWDTSVIPFLRSLGFAVRVIDAFDMDRFAAEGIEYLRHISSDENVKLQALNADLTLEQRIATNFLNSDHGVEFIKRPGTLADVRQLFADGWLVIPKVNSYVLDGEDGFDSHYLIITGMSERTIYVNDCGNPPQKNRPVAVDAFEKARQVINGIIAIKC